MITYNSFIHNSTSFSNHSEADLTGGSRYAVKFMFFYSKDLYKNMSNDNAGSDFDK